MEEETPRSPESHHQQHRTAGGRQVNGDGRQDFVRLQIQHEERQGQTNESAKNHGNQHSKPGALGKGGKDNSKQRGKQHDAFQGHIRDAGL